MTGSAVDGQVAFVTGAGRGIGRFVAEELARAGAAVVGFARSTPSPGGDGPGPTFERADVSDPGDVAAGFERATARVGAPDLVVALAGVAEALGPIHTVDADGWWRAVEIDLRGTMLTIREALRSMVPAGAGRIVTVYGNLGDRGGEHVSAFACAKAGVARLTESAAAETAGTGVVVVGVHPGFVRTPMTESLAWGDAGTTWLPSFGARAEDHWGGPEAAAELVLRIAAGEADQLSGRILRIHDDLETLTARASDDPDLRRLRLDLS